MTVAHRPSVRILLAAAAAGLLATAALAQDAPPPQGPARGAQGAAGQEAESPEARAERLRRAKERWERMSPAEREKMRRRFEEWQRLPPEKREELRRRLESLGGREGAEVFRRRIEDARSRSPEQLERMRFQAEAMRRIEERLLDDLPPRAAERLRAMPPWERERIRKRFTGKILALGREEALKRHGTPEEIAAVRGSDPKARGEALRTFQARMREAVLGPRRAYLGRLPPPERRAREAHLLEEDFWKGVGARLQDVRAGFHRALSEPGGPAVPGGRNGPDPGGRGGPEQRAVPALGRAVHLVPKERREEVLAAVRPELRRIAGLPLPEREAALKALLERIR